MAYGNAQVTRASRVPKCQIQCPVARKIDTAIRARGIKQIDEAATLTGSVLGELALEVKVGQIYPLDLCRRAISGLHQKKVCTGSRAIEYQAAFRQKLMPNQGKQRQQDADQQGS